MAGVPASLSVLCSNGSARLLSANLQHVVEVEGTLQLRGVSVNGFVDRRWDCARLAQSVVQALPGLFGYVGIDFVATPAGPLVLEVNPRLSVSYAGLHEALGVNPAGLVLELVRTGCLPGARCRRRRVDVELESGHVA